MATAAWRSAAAAPGAATDGAGGLLAAAGQLAVLQDSSQAALPELLDLPMKGLLADVAVGGVGEVPRGVEVDGGVARAEVEVGEGELGAAAAAELIDVLGLRGDAPGRELGEDSDALGAAAVEDGEVARRVGVGEERREGARDVVDAVDAAGVRALADDDDGGAVGVVGDQRAGGGGDRGTEAEAVGQGAIAGGEAGEGAGELAEEFGVGAGPLVDRLVGVADGGDRGALVHEAAQELDAAGVDVLEFVDEEMIDRAEQARVLTQDADGGVDHVGKVDLQAWAGGAQGLEVAVGVDQLRLLDAGGPGGRDQVGLSEEDGGRDVVGAVDRAVIVAHTAALCAVVPRAISPADRASGSR